MPSQSTLFLIEAIDIIGSTTIPSVFYGITFVLYCLCAQQLYLNLQKPDKRRQATFTLCYISVLFFCVTGIPSLGARSIQAAYIHHADFPGGPLKYEISPDTTTSKAYFIMIGGILDLIMDVLTMGIQIRRLWIIWSGTQYTVGIIILPVLLLLSYIGLEVPAYIVQAVVPPDQLGISDSAWLAMTAAFYVILSAFTILVTGLIAARLLLARRQHMKTMQMSELASPYISIVAMLVESYALETAWSLAAAISFASDSPSNIIFQTSDSTVKVIAYFLLVYRVETGRGWTKQTEEKLTSLQWNRGAQTVTDGASSIQSRVPATTTIVAITDSPSITHSDSA